MLVSCNKDSDKILVLIANIYDLFFLNNILITELRPSLRYGIEVQKNLKPIRYKKHFLKFIVK